MASAFFLAELGDKTMLATITLAADNDWVGVWIGSTVGMVAADALAIVVGAVAGKHLPERFIQLGAAALFLVFGVYMLVEGAFPTAPAPRSPGFRSPSSCCRRRRCAHYRLDCVLRCFEPRRSPQAAEDPRDRDASAVPTRSSPRRHGQNPAELRADAARQAGGAANRIQDSCRLPVWLLDGTAGIYWTDPGAAAAPAPPLPLHSLPARHAAVGASGPTTGQLNSLPSRQKCPRASIMR